ncbi:MAG: protein kinase [Myxococcota bacterium]
MKRSVAGQPHEIETLTSESIEAEPEPSLGELFADRYRIDRRIGRGSMATVYAAHDRVVDEMVALKLLATPSERALERFRREVRLARRVTHRNAARTFDLGEYAGAHFISMELVLGESLQTKLDQRPRLPVSEVVAIGRQICLGLQAAHDVDVIHRDLKPANVLVDEGGRAVITDFGVAWSARDSDDEGPQGRRSMAGTPAYMAPEQVMGVAFDARADLYALGVMLFRMLTGDTPWKGGNHIEVAMARLHRPPPDPRELADVPDNLAELVLRCMARDPERRPRNPAALAQSLHSLSDVGSTTLPPDGASLTAESSSFISTSPGQRALAVMPFQYRGPSDEAYLAEALSDELIDLLAMTRGLRVSASGATAQFKDQRDARTVGRALGVDAVIDGTVQRSPNRVRIVARLVDVGTGFQRWSERFEGRLEDVFEIQDRMAKRVAEALRVQLTLQGHVAVASADATEAYLRGRALARESDTTGKNLEAACEQFERARALAPDFGLPMAALADATVRRWFISRRPEGEHWAQRAQDAIADALERAPDLAESHLAAARLHVGRGDFIVAARELTKALEIAPTYAAAHEYLGMLQCEAGRSREGIQHIVLAHELDPSLNLGVFAVLRQYALMGDKEGYEATLARIRKTPNVPRLGADIFEFRLSLWTDDPARARAVQFADTSLGGGNISELYTAMVGALDLERPHAETTELMTTSAENAGSPRLRAVWRQIGVELLAWRGAIDEALVMLEQADHESVLLDADWLEYCPVLRPMQGTPRFDAIAQRVRQRANAIWHAGRDTYSGSKSSG